LAPHAPGTLADESIEASAVEQLTAQVMDPMQHWIEPMQ